MTRFALDLFIFFISTGFFPPSTASWSSSSTISLPPAPFRETIDKIYQEFVFALKTNTHSSQASQASMQGPPNVSPPAVPTLARPFAMLTRPLGGRLVSLALFKVGTLHPKTSARDEFLSSVSTQHCTQGAYQHFFQRNCLRGHRSEMRRDADTEAFSNRMHVLSNRFLNSSD